jgi:hypothetical protein
MQWIKNLLGGPQRGNISTILDMVIYAAGLVSDPRQIDPLLDKVRGLTSSLKPGQELARDQEALLVGVYLELEDYLVTKEPVRSFSREVLRRHLNSDLIKLVLRG